MPDVALLRRAACRVTLLRAATEPLFCSSAALATVALPPAKSAPLLLRPSLVVTCNSPLLRMLPLFSMRPSAVMVTAPAWAPMLPALRTPTPASVPIRRILPAYMPPRLETSSATCGREAASSPCFATC